jgi:hypothetical protein
MYSGYIGEYIAFAAHDRDFPRAHQLVLDALAQGYKFSTDRVETSIRTIEKAAEQLEAGSITQEQWESVYDKAAQNIYDETDKLQEQ